MAELDALGELANTLVVLTSDNGFFLGPHRFNRGKGAPYEEAIRVPLIVRGPGVAAGAVRREMVTNLDFAPTFAALAGATLGVEPDGRSLVPLLSGGAAADWRRDFLARVLAQQRRGRRRATAASRPGRPSGTRLPSTPTTRRARASSTTCSATPRSSRASTRRPPRPPWLPSSSGWARSRPAAARPVAETEGTGLGGLGFAHRGRVCYSLLLSRCRSGGIGRRARFRAVLASASVGSSPTSGTIPPRSSSYANREDTKDTGEREWFSRLLVSSW